MCYLGRMFFVGLGGDKDMTQARMWWQKAANDGHELATGMLAFMLREGLGGDKDMDQSGYLLQKAVERRHAEVFYAFGLILHVYSTQDEGGGKDMEASRV